MERRIRTRCTDNDTLLTRIVIMEKRMQNENDKNKLAEMERARAGMIAAYRCRLTGGNT